MPDVIEDIDDASFARIARVVYDRAGIVLGEAKRSLVSGRLRRRLGAHGPRPTRKGKRHRQEQRVQEITNLISIILINRSL